MKNLELQVRELRIERAEVAGRLAIIDEKLTLLEGADPREKEPVVYDLAARAGIASILADLVQGRD